MTITTSTKTTTNPQAIGASGKYLLPKTKYNMISNNKQGHNNINNKNNIIYINKNINNINKKNSKINDNKTNNKNNCKKC